MKTIKDYLNTVAKAAENNYALYEYLQVYKQCANAIFEAKYGFSVNVVNEIDDVNEGLLDSIKGIFGKKGGGEEGAEKSFWGSFSFTKWLAGGGKSGSGKDPVRDAYMKTLKNKMDNAKRRQQEMMDSKKKLKAQAILLKGQMEETALENAHQIMKEMIDTTTKELQNKTELWEQTFNSIKEGNTLPQAALNQLIEEERKECDNALQMIKGPKRNDMEKAESALMEGIFTPEMIDDPNSETNPPAKIEARDKDGNPIMRPKSPKEFAAWMKENPEKAKFIEEQYGRSADEIEKLQDNPEAWEQFLAQHEIYSSSGAEAEIASQELKLKNQQLEQQALAASISEAKNKSDEKNSAVKEYSTAKKAEAEAKKTDERFQNASSDVEKIAMMMFDPKKSPFKEMLADNKTEEQILSALKSELKIDADGKVTLPDTWVNKVDNHYARNEEGKWTIGNVQITDAQYETAIKPIKDKPAQKTLDAFNSKKDVAHQAYADAKAASAEAKETVKSKGIDNPDDYIDGETGEVKEDKKFKPQLSESAKKMMQNLGIEDSEDITMIESAVAAKGSTIKNGLKDLEEVKSTVVGNNVSNYERWKQAIKDNHSDSIYDANREYEDELNRKKENSLEPGEELKEGKVGYYRDGKWVPAPTELSALKDYKLQRKLDLLAGKVTNASGDPIKIGEAPKEKVVKYVEGGKVVMLKVPIDTEVDFDEKTGKPIMKDKDGNEVNGESIGKAEAMKLELKNYEYEQHKTEIRNLIQGKGAGDNDSETTKKVQQILDNMKGEEISELIKDYDIDDAKIDYDIEDSGEDEDDDDEETKKKNKDLKDAEDKIDNNPKLKKLKNSELKTLADEVSDYSVDEDGELKRRPEESTEDFEKRKEKFESVGGKDGLEALKSWKDSKDAFGNDEGGEEDTTDEGDKPQPPKRKIKKVAGKRKGTHVYIYKNENGKKVHASKKDWQANKRAWERYKRRLRDWQKENGQHSSQQEQEPAHTPTQERNGEPQRNQEQNREPQNPRLPEGVEIEFTDDEDAPENAEEKKAAGNTKANELKDKVKEKLDATEDEDKKAQIKVWAKHQYNKLKEKYGNDITQLGSDIIGESKDISNFLKQRLIIEYARPIGLISYLGNCFTH